MRQTYKINDDWIFIKENVGMEAAMTAVGEHISLPHTCNADVGRILRTFKIKKNVEVTDNGKDNF